MKLLLNINKKDCPPNMGQSQLFNNEAHIKTWLKDVAGVIPGATYADKKLTFTKQDGTTGYGIATEVPDDFTNA